MPESEMPELPEELPIPAFLASILLTLKLVGQAKTQKERDDAFLSSQIMDNNERFKQQYNSREVSVEILGQNNQLVIFDFPKVYVEQLERLLWPDWYTSCFTKSYHNSSVWAHYADSHKGACLIFEGVEIGNLNNLELKGATSSGARTMPFYEVNYVDSPGEIDFFRTISKLPMTALMKLWYTDQNGNISECASHIGSDSDQDTWRERYWNNFLRDITIKTRDWAYEQEYRLILGHGLIEFNKKKDRILTYDFNSLKGIIFGIEMSDVDKLKIIEIIEGKCKKHNRTDFKFFQAYHSLEHSEIRKHRIDLPFCDVQNAEE